MSIWAVAGEPARKIHAQLKAKTRLRVLLAIPNLLIA
jgi:hypothetical protein